MSEVLDLSPGAVFAEQFRVVRPLARGGMGAVYVVEQLGTARERALKLMHPLLASDERAIERFTREAQVASRIDSDHVVEVIAAGVDAKTRTPWLCMELLKGETLGERVERAGRLSLADTLEVVKQLGHALAAAHRAGIVHRDLKPENVFLATPRREGIPFTLKVLDFGVAALVQDRTSGGGAKTTQGVGSPMWMAPEQTNVGHVTTATDVWALGLIAFYLLTGKSYWRAPTIEGSSLTALLVEIMVEPLEPATRRAEALLASGLLPPGFDGWFSRTVARDVGHRYPEAGAAITDLVGVLDAAIAGRAPPRVDSGATSAAFAETGMQASPIPMTRVSPLEADVQAPSRDVATTATAPGASVLAPKAPSRVPLVVGSVLGMLLTCGLIGGYAIYRGLETATAQRATGAPTTAEPPDDDVHITPRGVEIHTAQGDSITLTSEGIDVEEAGEDEEEPAQVAAADEEDDSEAEEDEDDEEDASDDDEEAEEAEEDAPAPPRAPRPHGESAATAATAEARRSLIDTCWRDTFDGAPTPASTHWTFDFQLDAANRAQNVRITGPSDGLFASFRRCIVQRVGHFTSPDGTDHVAVTLP
jgi:serine/threonine protein kinase